MVTGTQAVVCVHPAVLSALSDCSQWPEGCAGGGVLLGSIEAECVRVDGAALLWYRLPEGITYQCWAPDQWRRTGIGDRQVIGSFVTGSPPHQTWEMLAAVGVSGLEAQVAAAALNGEVSFNAAGSVIVPEDWRTARGPAALFGMDPWRYPGTDLPETGARSRGWAVPGLVVAALGALCVAALAWFYAGRIAGPPPTPAAAPSRPSVVSAPTGDAGSPAAVDPASAASRDGTPAGGTQPSGAQTGITPSSGTQTGAGDTGSTGAKPGAEPTPTPPATYTVQPRDTLYAIAMHFYGDAAYVQKIRTANNLKGSNIVAGQRLTLPPKAG